MFPNFSLLFFLKLLSGRVEKKKLCVYACMKEKGMTENGMVGWQHQFDRHEFEQTPETVKDGEAWLAVVHGVSKSQT